MHGNSVKTIRDRLPFAAGVLIYLFINSMFVYRYAPRAGIENVHAALLYLAGFAIFAAGSFVAVSRICPERVPQSLRRFATPAALTLVSILMFAAMLHIDRQTIQVDRWSALTSFLDNMLDGKYPYDSTTHLGQKASPMPMMHLVALPFHFLGDVGYLQIFSFIALILSMRWITPCRLTHFAAVALLALSPAFWWECTVRSDLMSNMMLVIVLITALKNAPFFKGMKNPAASGLLAGLMCATRGVVVIPFEIAFVRTIIHSNWRMRVPFILCGILGFALAFLPFFLWSPELFFKNNPLILQTNKTPFYIQICALGAGFALSFITRDLLRILLMSGLTLFATMLWTFILSIAEHGFNMAIYTPYFDISYLNTALPFAILVIACAIRPKPAK